jgi:hypothetical protein
VYWDGNARGGGSIATGAVDLFSGNPIQVTLTYDGAVLHQTLLDTVTLDSFEKTFDVDIPLLAGGTTAFVGFTAANNSNASMPGVNQYISDFHFEGAAVPEPSSVLLLLIGVGVTCGIRRWGNKRRSDA